MAGVVLLSGGDLGAGRRLTSSKAPRGDPYNPARFRVAGARVRPGRGGSGERMQSLRAAPVSWGQVAAGATQSCE